MSEVCISASREGFHCSHCGWLAKVGSDESDRDHQADCPWRAFMAQAKKCSTCGGALESAGGLVRSVTVVGHATLDSQGGHGG